MSERDYGAGAIRDFLRAVDRNLVARARIVIIGGGAAALHNATSTTNDVDTCNAIDEALARAIADAVKETGIDIPITESTVADFPYNFEDRLERQLPELEHLEVWILEKHDLALSKVVRGLAHDDQQVRAIHQAVGLDFDVLVERFRLEMDHITTAPRLELQFLEMIETVFGELRRAAAERELKTKSGAGQS